ncbi:hypothetical protein [Archangium violaceum]|uniref:hypothetical protein n=1 Tax=Archangium violaceum TaxID=83451 RepID=UPI0036DEB4AC
MRTLTRRARAGILLAASLLPFSALAQTTPEISPEAAPESAPAEASQDPAQEAAPASPAPEAVQSPQPEAYPSSPPPAPEIIPTRKSLWRYSAQPGATQLDIGASVGLNSPSGIYGGEVEYRMYPILGLRVSGGQGAWGTRVGPQVRLYPLGEVVLSPFLEAGMSFNFGGETWSEIDGVRTYADMLLTPVGTLAVGSRLALGRLFFLSSRVGWSWRLRQDNVQIRGGGDPDVITAAALSLFQHEGFVISGSLGVSFF